MNLETPPDDTHTRNLLAQQLRIRLMRSCQLQAADGKSLFSSLGANMANRFFQRFAILAPKLVTVLSRL